MRPGGRRLLRPPPRPRGVFGQFLGRFWSIYEDRTDGSGNSIGMLKQILTVVLLVVGGGPLGQAGGPYQLPAALPLPDQNIRPYSSGYRSYTRDGTGKAEGSHSAQVRDGRVPDSADGAGWPARVDGRPPGTGSHPDFLSSAAEIGSSGGSEDRDGAPNQAGRWSAASPYFFQYRIRATDGESWRRESSDGAGGVRTSYGWKLEDHPSGKVNRAGGFRARVDSPAPAGFSSSVEAPSTSDSTSSLSASLGSATSRPASVSFQLAPGQPPAPSPYSFGYTVEGVDGGSSGREWSGKVEGSYSPKAKDGRSRKVEYTAEAEGFRATVDTNQPGTQSQNPAGVSFLSSAPGIGSVGSTADVPAPSTLPTSSAHPFRIPSEAQPRARPYSFAYTAEGTDGGSSRAEWSDGSGKVEGYYSLKAEDGRRRKVDYTADAGGFRATVRTNEPGTTNHSPAQISFLSSLPEGKAGTPSGRSVGDAPSGTAGGEEIGGPPNFVYPVEAADGAISGRKWWNGRGHVPGSHSSKLKDGRKKKAERTAHASAFRATVQTDQSGTGNRSPADVIFRSSAPARPDFNPETTYPSWAPSSPLADQKIAAARVSSHPTSSASPSPYLFSYHVRAKDGGSSRREWSDAAGNVEGSYSLNVNDGRRRKVEYRADAGGFRATVDTDEPGTRTLYSAPVGWRSSIPDGPGPLGRPAVPPDQRTGHKSWL